MHFFQHTDMRTLIIFMLFAAVRAELPLTPSPIPMPPAPDLVTTLNWEHLCANDDADMQKLYEENLMQDIFYWKHRLDGRKLNRTMLLDLIDSLGGRHGRDNERGAATYISSEHNIVMIKDNKWYTPFRPFEFEVNCTQEKTWCDARMMFSQWAFERWTRDFGMVFPDVVFYHDTGDAGACLPAGPCSVPVITYFRQRLQMQFPHQEHVKNGDYTLLMPSVYTDLDRDARTHGVFKPAPLYFYPWAKKKEVAIFRGSGYCNMWHLNKVVRCPRWFLTNESYYNGQGAKIDVRVSGWDENYVGHKVPPYDPMPLREAARYKYVLALDGVSASNRFSKLLGTNSVVLKEDSPYMGHFYRSVHAYEHYLPIFERHSLDILDVFATYNTSERDVELQRIVYNAQTFAAKYLCDRAIALYFRKLLVEYKDLFDDMQGFVDSYVWPLVQAKEKLHIDLDEHNKIPNGG